MKLKLVPGEDTNFSFVNKLLDLLKCYYFYLDFHWNEVRGNFVGYYAAASPIYLIHQIHLEFRYLDLSPGGLLAIALMHWVSYDPI